MLNRRFLIALLLIAGMLCPPLANAVQAVRAQRGGDAAGAPDTLGESRLKRPRPNVQQPPLWQLRQALRAPQEREDPNAPVVDVSAEAALTPPGTGDLDPTIDVQITQEIIDKAAELGSVQAMYEFVRNDCAFQTYYGSQKGSVETLRQRAGNDYDLASLLIALLRSSGIPARYADGIVELPVARVTSWLGVDDGTVAGSILFTTGMEGVSIIDGQSNVVAVRCRRVWVEAFVSSGFGSPTWRPLDPSFAETFVDAGVDIPEAMMLDSLGFLDEYWNPTDGSALPRPETILELLRQDIQDYLDINLPGTAVDDAMRKHEIVAQHLGLLPNSLPYTVRSRDSMYSEIPADRRYQIRFHLYNGGTNLIDITVNLPELAGRRVTVDYQGATPTDEAILDANGGIYATNPSTVDLTPVLRIDGSVVATGSAGVGMGLFHSSDVHFLAPVNQQGLPQNVVPSISNSIVCGASQAIGIAVEGVAEGLLTPPPADDTEGTLSLLYDTAMDYMANVRNDGLALGRMMHGYVTTGITSAIVDNVVKVTYGGGGVPQTFDWVGLRVDADRSIIGYWRVESFDVGDTEPRDFLTIAGAGGSLWENQIFEKSYGQDSISTIKILELAVDAGVTVYTRWNTLPLPPNTQSASVQNSIANAIAIGHEVTFPADPMTVGTPETGEWTGTAWIDMDPSNGAAGYLISGANNGGATVETWPPVFIDLSQDDKTVEEVEVEIITPAADSPACDAVFTRDNEENLTFEYLVHVTYDDASTNTLGPYQRVTRNTTKTLFPGNYTFTVWISRRVWWFFNSTIAEAQRDVSIVGVLIREDDGTDIGAAPPKSILVEPPGATDTPSKDLKALVIPEQAPDGTPMATAYNWSTTALLTFTDPTMQMTKIEPAGPDPSAMIDDEDVDVEVTLVCGLTANGFAKFNFAEGGMDEPHKMTVISVEIEKCDNAFMPMGGSSDNSVDITSRALPMDVKGRFIFELFDISDENGYAMNAPDSLPFFPWSEDGLLFKDYQFEDQAGYNIDGVFWNHTAKTDDSDLNEATVQVSCYDYGAYGKIRVTFEYEGEEIIAIETGGTKDHTNLPLDDDDNHIADMWPDNAGNANDDNDNNPALGISMGDGLSRYEEFRGFNVMGVHTRTDPSDKDLFIYDDDGIGFGNFAALGLTTHSITEEEFNGTNKREINFRRESDTVVLQHGLWLRDFNLGPNRGNWGLANNPAGVPDSPGNFLDVRVDMAQVVADMTNAPPVGFQPVGANNRTGVAQAQLIAHEIGHAVAIWHHQVQAGCADPAGTHCGNTGCVMRYYFRGILAAIALGPPGDVPAFNIVPIGNTFCNIAPDICRSDVDVSDQ